MPAPPAAKTSGEKAAAKKLKAKENKAKANPKLAEANKASADAKRERRAATGSKKVCFVTLEDFVSDPSLVSQAKVLKLMSSFASWSLVCCAGVQVDLSKKCPSFACKICITCALSRVYLGMKGLLVELPVSQYSA